MKKHWLSVAATIAVTACASVGLRAVGESTLTVELPSSMRVDNPFATQPNETPMPLFPNDAPARIAESTEIARAMPVEPADEPLPMEVPRETRLADVPEAPTSAVGAKTATEWVEAIETPPASEPEFPPPTIAELPVHVPVLPPIERPAADSLPVVAESAPSEAWTPPATPENEMLESLESIWPEPEQSTRSTAPITPEFDAASMGPYTPTVEELSYQLLPSVRRAYALAQRGALFAAQAEFVCVLHRIAQAKDAEAATDEYARALAAGLRALDEADDFMPDGVQLEAEMNVSVIASSHRTPPPEDGTPSTAREAIGHYHQYAQGQLAECAAGERAGSMALHGLGKIYNRLASDSGSNLRHERKAISMFLAALKAEPENHLAANEVGVMLARSGRPAEAAAMFRRAIDITPTSTNYHNLAMVERKLGQYEQANANEQYSLQLAARDRAAGALSRSKGVRWIAPQEMAQMSGAPQPVPPPANAAPIGPIVGGADEAKSQAVRPALPRGPRGSGDVSTAARWPQKLIPSGVRR